jgi:hypothetical protein
LDTLKKFNVLINFPKGSSVADTTVLFLGAAVDESSGGIIPLSIEITLDDANSV